MKILFIRSLNPYFESSASANRYSGLIDGLLGQGAEVTLVVTQGYNNFNEYKLKGKLDEGNNLEIKYLVPTFHHNIWLRRINVYLLSSVFQFIINVRLRRYFSSNFDIVWLTYEKKILTSFCKYKEYVRGKTLIELNEYNDLHLNEPNKENVLHIRSAKKENQVFLNALKKIDLLAVMTNALIKHYKLLSKPDALFFHLPMTVDIKRFLNIKTESFMYKQPYIAYTGTFNNQKDGVDVLIHAFARIADKYPNHKLYLAGFYYYDVTMQKELIEKYKLKDRVIYIDAIVKDKIPVFIKNAELLVMARPNSRQAQGGFPTKLGEYLATGNPVCVTCVGEIPEYLEDNVSAFMAEPGNVDSFVDAMHRALSNKEDAKRTGLNGLKIAEENFSLDLQSKRLFEFLKENI